MEILVTWPGSILVHLGVLEMLFTILTCYIIAVSLGHVPLWLPMISDCAVKPPEKYLFRWGIVIGSSLIALLSVSVYYASKSRPFSKLCCILGVIGPFCLSVVGVVNEVENKIVHDIFAVTFFVCYDLYMIITVITYMTYETGYKLCSLSFAIKVLCSLLGFAAGVGYVLCLYKFITIGSVFVALFEWVNTFTVMLFVWSYVLDNFLSNVNLSEVRSSSQVKIKQKDCENY